MKLINRCVICDSKDLSNYKAVIAPFLVSRIWGSKTKKNKIRLFQCRKCEFAFFNLRFEEKEMAALYKNYRDDAYQRERNQYEDWYTKEVNEEVGNGKKEIEKRNANLSSLLKNTIDVSKIKTVLDFGGDKGQFIPDLLKKAKRYVYEISGTKALPGVKSIDNIESLKLISFDFIMCCHVLEHTPFPMQVLKQIKALSHEDSFFYFELPLDPPFLYSDLLTFKNLVKRVLFIIEPIRRKFFRTLLMHEHINFYSKRSLGNILDLAGFDVVKMSVKTFDLGWVKPSVLCCLAKNK